MGKRRQQWALDRDGQTEREARLLFFGATRALQKKYQIQSKVYKANIRKTHILLNYSKYKTPLRLHLYLYSLYFIYKIKKKIISKFSILNRPKKINLTFG